jgi:hypothetical protein
MATQHNFRIKNGLEVGGVLIVNSSGQLQAASISGAITATSIGVTNIVTNKVVKFNGTILDDSNITDTGSLITLGSNTAVTGTLNVNSSSLSGTQVYIKKLDESTNLQRWGEGTSGASTYRFRIDQGFKFIANSGSGDKFILFSDTGNVTTDGTITSGVHQITDGTLNIYNSGAGAVIGSIGNTANDINIYSTSAGHNGLRMHADGILPTNNAGTIVDNDADLGHPSYRFKNLHLSGTITSGAITSSGGIESTSLQTSNIYLSTALYTLNTAGNGWDSTINRNSGSPTANLPGGITSGNITTTGYLRGPSTFTIDPAAHGDDTGTVVIAGNLQIDGTTTTINSTTLTVDDKNITLASGSANAAAANGAGITVDGASANITYTSTTDEWDFNKSIHVSGASGSGIKINSGGAIVGGGASGGDTQLMYWGGGPVYYGRSNAGGTVSGHEFRVGGVTKLNVNSSGNTIASGNVGIGTASPTSKLHVQGAATPGT